MIKLLCSIRNDSKLTDSLLIETPSLFFYCSLEEIKIQKTQCWVNQATEYDPCYTCRLWKLYFNECVYKRTKINTLENTRNRIKITYGIALSPQNSRVSSVFRKTSIKCSTQNVLRKSRTFVFEAIYSRKKILFQFKT